MTAEVWIVFDLGFGDAGKGATVDFLVRDREADLVIRYHGGAQAGHNVISPDGRHHTFSQFGSGTFVPEVRTLLGPEFVLHPGALALEHQRLCELGVTDALSRLFMHESALVISPFQQAAGRLREIARGSLRHGTCGVGFGEAVQDVVDQQPDTIRAHDLRYVDNLAVKLRTQQARKCQQFAKCDVAGDRRAADEWQLLNDHDAVDRTLTVWRSVARSLRVATDMESRRIVQRSRTIICEGAQGVLLDQEHGFHPHTTWSDCTPR